MSLATRCPYCQTTFRVTHDQLKLRGGLVRCGACKEIFNGVEHLLPPLPLAGQATPAQVEKQASPPPDAPPPFAPPAIPAIPAPNILDAAPQPAPTADASDQTANAAPVQDGAPTSGSPASVPPDSAPSEEQPDISGSGDLTEPAEPAVEDPHQADQAEPRLPVEEPTSTEQPGEHTLPATTAEQDLDPLTRMTLMDMRPWPGQSAPEHEVPSGLLRAPSAPSSTEAPARSDEDEVERAIDDLQSKPWRGTSPRDQHNEPGDEIDALDDEEPEFVRQARLQQQRGRRLRLVFGGGSVLLLLLALLQGALLMRTAIAAQWPATAPALTQLCSVFGCMLGLPAQIEYVTIEASELQALPSGENNFQLSTLLRNRSSVMQAWPFLELTLNDANEQPVARRVLTPTEYLGPQESRRGLPGASEKPVRVTLQLSQLKASGYRLYVFYP